jgi:hemolysin activation/secretion protein
MLDRLILFFYNKLQKNKKSKSSDFVRHFGVAAIVSAHAMMLSNYAMAADQKAPDAGQILQEIERDIDVRPLPKLPEIEQAAPQQEDQGPRVVIKQFKFEGNKSLSDAQLQDALATLTNREISVTELKTCTDLISAYYRQNGYLATATLPEQDITEGVVIINIVEAIFGDVKFDGEYNKDFKRVKPSVIENALGLTAQKGKTLNQDKLDKGLARTGNLAGVEVQGTLQAGTASGTTDLLVKVKDQPLFSTYLSVDNGGGRATGRNKGLALLTLASPLGYGETFTVTGLHSLGTDYGKAAVMLPLGASGLQVGASASYMQYDIVAGVGVGNGTHGESTTFGLNAQYPLLVEALGKITSTLEAEKKYFVNQSPLVAQHEASDQDYSLQVYSVALNGDYTDSFLAGAVSNASLNLGAGNVSFSGSGVDHIAGDANGAHTQGSFSRLRWSLSRNQFFNDTLALSLNASGQFADSNLDSSEKFYLGGTSGVRSYPTSEGGGSEGYLVTAELRKYLPNNFTVSTFVDHGQVTQFANNQKADGTGEISGLNIYQLTGYGASLNWQGPYNTNIKATYSRRMGSNPNRLASGADSDGARIIDQLWINASVSF